MSESKKNASYDLNMRVTVAAKLTEEQAYWCIPGLQTEGPGKGKFCSYVWGESVGFELPDKLKLVISYPFDKAYTEEYNVIREYKWKKANGEEVVGHHRQDAIGDIIWAAAQAYHRAFKWAKENNVGYWHGIGDLVFEGMTIFEDGTVEFLIGS